MNGLDALERIRVEFETPLPVVMLTGAGPDTDVATELVEKPFTRGGVRAIEHALG